jgi:hypothetical protein
MDELADRRRVVHRTRRLQEAHDEAAHALALAAAAHLVHDSYVTAGTMHEALTEFTTARVALHG